MWGMRAYFALPGAIRTKMVLRLLGDNTSDFAGNCNQSVCLTLRGGLIDDESTVDLGFLQKNQDFIFGFLLNKVNRC